MSVGDFIENYCYDGAQVLITGVGADADEYFEGQYGRDDIPDNLLESTLRYVFARESMLVLECDTND